ncbi:glycosyl hydrolase family 95 catalytic domain-containing protein [Aquipluma nitroreducens]|nr:glycoside hydrolase N-terminal domain-containing protein [Aquipluma nitroreducens]
MKTILVKLILILTLGLVLNNISAQERDKPQRFGFSYSFPETYRDWPNAFMAGNGKMGIIVFCNPLNETVIFNDRGFFMASTSERKFNQVSKEDLNTIRDYCINGDYKMANTLAVKAAGWVGGGEQDKHPGFEMLISTPEDGEIRNYSRICNYRTGEIVVKWTDNRGDWERKSFVSRADDVIVQYLTPPKGKTVTCSIQLGTDPGMHFPSGMTFTNASDVDNLNMRVNYPSGTNGAGYEGVVRVIVSGGKKSLINNTLKVSDANSIILMTRTKKYYSDCEKQWEQENIQFELKTMSSDYNTLLKGQISTHQAIYDRVKFDLNAGKADRTRSNEELLDMQKKSTMPVKALWERIFDSGRYYYLSSSSTQSPPDLLGLWTGDCKVGWKGWYHLDANLNLQIAGGNIGNMPEAMEGYFTLIERLAPGFETNATKLLGCRGMLSAGNTAGLNGLRADVNTYYPYSYCTGEMGWLLYPFWEHYLISGDTTFLRNRIYPLFKKMGYFYEDFLKVTDSNGNYIFAGSISPENQPKGLGISLVNNSTYDISGAKFCLTALIKTCNILGLDQGSGQSVEKWTSILNKLPPYLINDDGALMEWSWKGLNDNYSHRHSSHLITVWPFREITPENNPTLFTAVRQTLMQKDAFNYENAGHGLLHSALIAANLKNWESLNSKMMRLVSEDYYYGNLISSHYNGHNVFCTDVCNAVPAVLMEMLISSEPGVLELLPALPQSLEKGSIEGIKGRNRITVQKLTWNMRNKTLKCTLISDVNQDISLIIRNGINHINCSSKIIESPLGDIAKIISLSKGISTEINIRLGEMR